MELAISVFFLLLVPKSRFFFRSTMTLREFKDRRTDSPAGSSATKLEIENVIVTSMSLFIHIAEQYYPPSEFRIFLFLLLFLIIRYIYI